MPSGIHAGPKSTQHCIYMSLACHCTIQAANAVTSCKIHEDTIWVNPTVCLDTCPSALQSYHLNPEMLGGGYHCPLRKANQFSLAVTN